MITNDDKEHLGYLALGSSILEEGWVRLFSRLPTTVHWHRRALRQSQVAQRKVLAGSTRESICCQDHLRVQLFRLHRRGRILAQGGRSRRQEGAEVKAYLLKRPCWCAGPAA